VAEGDELTEEVAECACPGCCGRRSPSRGQGFVNDSATRHLRASERFGEGVPAAVGKWNPGRGSPKSTSRRPIISSIRAPRVWNPP
jgi:hypothetical protein